MTNPPERHPLTIEVLSAHLDYLLERVKTTIQEAEALRVRNDFLASRLTACSQDRDTYKHRYETLHDLALYALQLRSAGQDDLPVVTRLRAMLALPPVTPTAVEGGAGER